MFEKIVLWEFEENDFDSDYWERVFATSTKVVRVSSKAELKTELPSPIYWE